MNARLLTTFLALAGLAPFGRCEGPSTRAVRADRYGDPLPPGAIARLGTLRWRHPGATWLAYAPDGKSLYSAGHDLRQWDRATGRLLQRWPLPLRLGSVLAVRPDGRAVLVLDYRGLSLVDVATAAVRWTIKHDPHFFATIAISPDGKQVAVRDKNENSVLLRDGATGRELRRLGTPGRKPKSTPHGHSPDSLAFSPDGKLLAAARQQGDLRVWQVATGKELLHRREKSGTCALAFTPDGKRLAWADDKGVVHLWEVAGSREVRRLRCLPQCPDYLVFSPGGRRLVCSTNAGAVHVWGVTSGKELWNIPSFDWGWSPGVVAFSPDGKEIAAVRGAVIERRDAQTGKVRGPLADPFDRCRLVTFSPDGRYLASVEQIDLMQSRLDALPSSMERLRIWDVADGRPLWQREVEESFGPTFSPDGKSLAFVAVPLLDAKKREAMPADKEPAARGFLVETATGKEQRRFALPVVPGREAVEAYSTWVIDGADLILQVGNRRFWLDRTTGKERRRRTPPGWDLITAVNFTRVTTERIEALVLPERDGALASPPTEIRLRDWEADRELPSWKVNGPLMRCAALSADGRTLVLLRTVYDGNPLDDDGTDDSPGIEIAQLYETATGLERGRFEVSAVGGHVALAPGGRLLVTVNTNRSGGSPLRLWDMYSGKALGRLPGHPHEIHALAFSPDGRRLATASRATTVLIWDVSRHLAPARAPALSPRELDALWADLASANARRAFQAIGRLAGSPRHSVPFLATRLRPARAPDPGRMARLLADLDSSSYATRRRAVRELVQIGDLAAPALRAVLKTKPSLEVRRRVEELLAPYQRWAPSAEDLRLLRALEVLEQAGTPEARDLLASLAGGAPDSWRTREAAGALRRVNRRAGTRERKR